MFVSSCFALFGTFDTVYSPEFGLRKLQKRDGI